VNPTSEFKIQFSGLSDGTHKFDFEINNKFFELINSDLIKNGNLIIHATMHKTSSLLTFDFTGDGTIDVECDRCTCNSKFPIAGDEEAFLLVKLDNNFNNEDSDIITLPKEESEIDLSNYIFEFINTLVPLSIIPCEFLDDDTLCNQEVLDKLNQLSERKIEIEEIDPRWSALKNLKNKNDN
jgi:uncharacterized metal-binding protein YceD (DUF177 family)